MIKMLLRTEPSLDVLGTVAFGVDGSPQGERALDWAISPAQRRGTILDIETAWLFPMALGYAFTTTVQQGASNGADL